MVSLCEVTKKFGDVVAVRDVSLEIRAGEFLTLLGPSGCGKTTMLRIISGFETPTSGSVFLDGQDVTFLPPYRRNVNQVFQSYALFPHLDVWGNVAFGLKMQRLGKREISDRITEALALVSLDGMERRRPEQLSGGQRQRVALARALVCHPKVLLLDEPLSALDAKLRRQMQIELKRLQRKLGITFICVTHDQEEALTMSDRIAVVNEGRIEQLGSVDDVYHSPETRFVAQFLGQSNIIEAELCGASPALTARLPSGTALQLPAGIKPGANGKMLLSIRPEKIRLHHDPLHGENVLEARVVEEVFKGATDQLLIRTACGIELTVIVANEGSDERPFHEGDQLYCRLHPDDLFVIEEP